MTFDPMTLKLTLNNPCTRPYIFLMYMPIVKVDSFTNNWPFNNIEVPMTFDPMTSKLSVNNPCTSPYNFLMYMPIQKVDSFTDNLQF